MRERQEGILIVQPSLSRLSAVAHPSVTSSIPYQLLIYQTRRTLASEYSVVRRRAKVCIVVHMALRNQTVQTGGGEPKAVRVCLANSCIFVGACARGTDSGAHARRFFYGLLLTTNLMDQFVFKSGGKQVHLKVFRTNHNNLAHLHLCGITVGLYSTIQLVE